MTCDTGVHGFTPAPDDGYCAEYNYLQDGDLDTPLDFALFGLARQGSMPDWVKPNWSKPVLDLGPGNKLIHGAIRCEYPKFNFESPEFNPPATIHHTRGHPGYPDSTGTEYFDKNSPYRCYLPWADNSIGGIFAVNIFEHLWDPRPIMEECARVLAPGCPLNIVVPHGSHGIYYQDLDHKKPFILDSWKNWLDNKYWGEKERGKRLNLVIGANFKFGIKEENVNIVTQLIKTQDDEVQEIKDFSGEPILGIDLQVDNRKKG